MNGVRRGARWAVPAAAIAATVLLVAASFLAKSSCLSFGGWGAHGVTLHDSAWATAHVCGTDIQRLWKIRALWEHLPPYLQGVFTPPDTLTGGTVEYPVLSGLWIWATSVVVTTDTAFVALNAALFVPIAVATTWLLWRMAGRRVWIWALAPALVEFAVYNWDLAPTLCAVGGLAAIVLRRERWSDARIAVVAGLCFGLGGALKVYPAFLVLPLGLWLLRRALDRGASRRRALGLALAPAVTAGVLVLLINLPFAVLGFRGWWASFDFQSHRGMTFDTQSVWYWALRLVLDPTNPKYLSAINLATSAVVALGILAVLWWGWRATRGGEYPLVPVAAAVVAADMVLGKVHSPQYILWLVPLLALSRVRVRWILVYYVADLALWGVWNAAIAQLHTLGHGVPLLTELVALFVGVRALAILVLVVAMLRPTTLRAAPMGLTGAARRDVFRARARAAVAGG